VTYDEQRGVGTVNLVTINMTLYCSFSKDSLVVPYCETRQSAVGECVWVNNEELKDE
jgi:hypothetical protein